MNWRIAMYGFIVLMGALNVFLQVWLLLLDDGQPEWLFMGFFFMFVGGISIMRERRAMQDKSGQ